eukprot:1182344-Prorocentrum_minimum.AAC.1
MTVWVDRGWSGAGAGGGAGAVVPGLQAQGLERCWCRWRGWSGAGAGTPGGGGGPTACLTD